MQMFDPQFVQEAVAVFIDLIAVIFARDRPAVGNAIGDLVELIGQPSIAKGSAVIFKVWCRDYALRFELKALPFEQPQGSRP